MSVPLLTPDLRRILTDLGSRVSILERRVRPDSSSSSNSTLIPDSTSYSNLSYEPAPPYLDLRGVTNLPSYLTGTDVGPDIYWNGTDGWEINTTGLYVVRLELSSNCTSANWDYGATIVGGLFGTTGMPKKRGWPGATPSWHGQLQSLPMYVQAESGGIAITADVTYDTGGPAINLWNFDAICYRLF